MARRTNPFVGLITVIIIIMLMLKVGGESIDSSTCVCKGDICHAVTLGAVDFQTSEQMCQKMKGELMTVRSAASAEIIGDLLVRVTGYFWIGLRLPDDQCSNIESKLRGYQWTTGFQIADFSNWKDNVNVCAPRCVSVSTDRMWTERPCQEKVDGFLCQNVHKSTCQTPHMEAQEFSHQGDVIYSNEGCAGAPCEHTCTDVPGGYKCSCFERYIPRSENPNMCKMHCSSANCPVICDRNSAGTQCNCPGGFLKSDDSCQDIDECENGYCDQLCDNMFGSFVCSCRAGFSLQNVVKCVKTDGHEMVPLTTPVYSDFLTPGFNFTSNVSSATTGIFLWVWIFIAAAVIVLILVVRYCVSKRHEQNVDSQQRCNDEVL
ncbi:thrombomodulin [Coregonus clupeaformis]|uniref:thrombomodulin n=1 Tax=Coregonus clupeaformis TaxID=59861 RepID=UPI001E1C5158|nr:thrombomodulin [Coregonus clupeaformis]